MCESIVKSIVSGHGMGAVPRCFKEIIMLSDIELEAMCWKVDAELKNTRPTMTLTGGVSTTCGIAQTATGSVRRTGIRCSETDLSTWLPRTCFGSTMVTTFVRFAALIMKTAYRGLTPYAMKSLMKMTVPVAISPRLSVMNAGLDGQPTVFATLELRADESPSCSVCGRPCDGLSLA